MEKQIERYFTIDSGKNKIQAKIYCEDGKGIEKLVIFGHGFGGHRDNRAAEKFAGVMLEKCEKNALITFDWPGHGDDKEPLTLDGCSSYLKSVLAYAKTELNAKDICAYATSFGGYLFLKYIIENDNPFRRIALRCPAVNMYDVLARKIMSESELTDVLGGNDILVGFDRKIEVNRCFLESVKASDIRKSDYSNFADRILIIQGTEDELVSFQAVKEFAEANSLDFIPVPGADHRFTDPSKMDAANEMILNYFA